MLNLSQYKKLTKTLRSFSQKIDLRAALLVAGLLIPAHSAYALPLLLPFIGTAASGLASYVGGGFLLDAASSVLASALVAITSLIFKIAGLFMTSMGYILDQSIMFTINSEIYKSVSAIEVGWTAVRDLSNMFFIFVLLFIAIQTILGMGSSNTKRWVASLIIAALLINFSLFFTRVVVDAGNVLAVGFWNKLTIKAGAREGQSATSFFMEGFRVQTAVQTTKNDAGAEVLANDKYTQAQVYLGGALVQFVAGYVFLAGAIMMIIRSVTIMILMIASPFAFLGFALPKGGGFASQWLSKLIAATFMAPAFIFMLYIDSLIIRGAEITKIIGADKSSLALAFGGVGSNFPIIYNFILMIILLLAALKVAHAVGGSIGTSSGDWAKKAIGQGSAMGFAGAAIAGRQSVGRFGRSIMQNEKWVKEQNKIVAKAGMKDAKFMDKVRARGANLQLTAAQNSSKGTFDIRNAPMGGLGVTAALGAGGINAGKGSTQSFEKNGAVLSSLTGAYQGAEREHELIELAKKRFPNNAAAQRAFLEQKGVQIEKVEGQYDRNKSVREELNKGIVADAEKIAPGDRVAQEKYIREHLRNENVTERTITGYEDDGKPIYGDTKVSKNIWDTPAMKEQRLKLQTQVTTQVAQQAIQSAIDSTDPTKNPVFAQFPPEKQQILAREAEQRIREHTSKASPQAIAQLSKDYLEHPSVSKYLSPAQLRAISANQDIGDTTIEKIQQNAYKHAETAVNEGRDPNQAIPSLDLYLNARSDSRLNTNPQETVRIKALIEKQKEAQKNTKNKPAASARFQELFQKTNLTRAEEQELNDLRNNS